MRELLLFSLGTSLTIHKNARQASSILYLRPFFAVLMKLQNI